MKTSVVLSAYNGEKFIVEQLESIFNQTLPIDEVLILDDCSTDKTFAICTQFIKERKLENWTINCNENNLGYIANFQKGFNQASGDIIFIVDQDDVWCENKVKRTVEMFNKLPDAKSICSAFSRFNEGKILSDHVPVPNRTKGGYKKIRLSEFCRFHSYLGMTTAFRKELVELHYDQCCKLITYDIAINFIAVIENGLYFLDEVLVKRRSYPQSTSNKMNKDTAIDLFKGNTAMFDIYATGINLKGFKNYIEQYANTPLNKALIDNYIMINDLRMEALSQPNIWTWLKLVRHIKYFRSSKNYINDGVNILTSITKKINYNLKLLK